jgi:hypothetical protein
VFVVTVMSPAALALTRIEIGRTSFRLPCLAWTVRVLVRLLGSARDLHVEADGRVDAGASRGRRRRRSRRRGASRSSLSGTPDTVRATLPWTVEVTLRSKLAFAPGATATAG